MNDFYFIKKGYKELKINFVKIEFIYDYCTTFFRSCLAIYRYIKAKCNAPKRVTLVETSSNPVFTRSIFHFITKLLTFGFGLVFRRWSYATTLIFFDLTILSSTGNFKHSIYLDKSCKVTLINKT